MVLYFASLAVGKITTLLFSDQTWYGMLQVDASIKETAVGRMILEYISFSETWHERLKQHDHVPPSPSEFDTYSGLLESDQWSIKTDEPMITHHVDAPVFLPGGDFSCRPLGL